MQAVTAVSCVLSDAVQPQPRVQVIDRRNSALRSMHMFASSLQSRAPRMSTGTSAIALIVAILFASPVLAADLDSGRAGAPAMSAFQQLGTDERNAVVRHDGAFSIVVREYLVAHDAISRQGAGVPHAGTPIAIDVALRLIRLGLVRKLVIGEGRTAYLVGASGQIYRTSQAYETQVLETANSVDPAALFIIRVEPEH